MILLDDNILGEICSIDNYGCQNLNSKEMIFVNTVMDYTKQEEDILPDEIQEEEGGLKIQMKQEILESTNETIDVKNQWGVMMGDSEIKTETDDFETCYSEIKGEVGDLEVWKRADTGGGCEHNEYSGDDTMGVCENVHCVQTIEGTDICNHSSGEAMAELEGHQVSYDNVMNALVYKDTKEETKVDTSENVTDDIQYKCYICGKAFNLSSTLKQHVVVHTGGKSHTCNTCGKTFTRFANLKAHLRTHTGEKPYTCDICQKAFTQPAFLKKHIMIHTGEKPYKCDFCWKTFTQSSNRRDHLKTHTGEKPYKCDICGRDFTNTGHVQHHMKTHTGEKPYRCDICDKVFTQSSNLKRHVMTHSGEKPYTCNSCGKAFIQLAQLKQHMKTHISIEEMHTGLEIPLVHLPESSHFPGRQHKS